MSQEQLIPLIVIAVFIAGWDPFRIGPRRGVRGFASALVVACAMVAVVIVHPFSAPRPDGRLHVEYLDVGQGDAALVVTSDGRRALIDGGPAADLLDAYLTRDRIDRLDLVIEIGRAHV